MSYWEQANPGTRAIRTAFNLDRMGVNGLPLRSERMPVYPSEFAAATTNAMIPALLGAEKARQHADSYRGFLVGAAAVAYFYSEHGARKMNFAHGANIKPTQGSDEINVHAEQIVLAAIEADRRQNEEVYVPVLAVVGDLQPDQQSGVESLTLPPCGVCRGAFMQSDTAVDHRTLFVTGNPAFTAFEWFSLSALEKKFRGEHAPTGLAQFDRRLLTLTPPDIEGKAFLRLSDFDTPEDDRDAAEYDEKMRNPVGIYVQNMVA